MSERVSDARVFLLGQLYRPDQADRIPANQEINDLCNDLLDVRAQLQALEPVLAEANDLLRSAYAVAQRDGKDTNWRALQSRIYDALQAQHHLMYPTPSSTESVGEKP